MTERRARYVVACHPDDSRRALAAAVSPRQWEQTIEDLLTLHGWLWVHVRDARRQAVEGFPDYLAVRAAENENRSGYHWRLVAIEAKTGKGRTTPAQDAWLNALAGAGAETYIWRPTDRDTAEEVLRQDGRRSNDREQAILAAARAYVTLAQSDRPLMSDLLAAVDCLETAVEAEAEAEAEKEKAQP